METRRVANMSLSTAARVTATAPAPSASLIHGLTAIRRISSGTQTTVPLPTPTRSAKHSLKSASKSAPALYTSSFSPRPSTEASIARPPSHARPQEEQNPATLELNKWRQESQQDNRSDETAPSPGHTPWDGNDDDGRARRAR
ncbi:uncharacterized protein K441DRAFT_9066 [Cenococcum geophilum 1.58]|uniref:uncharacterized protein n=1 Tax=Cenococcum geophilum 1.58 TaxID=794803 RepID=UPI00358E2367|nr:hypothetical protein K441DRAFT_9066 [Cenococcum geophilum 1.58]